MLTVTRCVVLGILALAAPLHRTDTVVAPASDAVLCGLGDAYEREPLSEQTLDGTPFEDIQSLAGSWVYMYEVTFYVDRPDLAKSRESQLKRVKLASQLTRELASEGFVAIAVTRTEPQAANVFPELDHPLWVTRTLGGGRGPEFGSPTLLDDWSPSEMLIDPAGMIAQGGRSLPRLGESLAGTGIADLVKAHPGLALADVEAGTKLRGAIAKRRWASAFKLATSDAVRERLDRIVEAQIAWAEFHCDNGDGLSAGARLDILDDVPRKDPRVERISELTGRLKRDKSLANATDLQADIVKVAEEMNDNTRFHMQFFPVTVYKRLDKALRRVEGAEPSGAGLVMARSVRNGLEASSPLTPCRSCGEPRHDCDCR